MSAPDPNIAAISLNRAVNPADANNSPTPSPFCDMYAQRRTLGEPAGQTCLIVSPPFACGVTRLVNALLELDIRATNPGFEPEHWQLQPTAHWHIGDLAAKHLKWHLPVLHQRQTFNFPEKLEVIWEHRMDFARLGPHPTILFVRDPRDAIHSLYQRSYASHMDFLQYLKRSNKWPDHFPDLFYLPPFETFAYFVSFWHAMEKSMPVKIIRFEDLKQTPLACMKEVLNFIGIVRTDEEIAQAIGASSFENAKQAMEEMERETRQEFKTARKAQIGEWKTSFSPTELACSAGLGQYILENMGYESATDTSTLPTLDMLITAKLTGAARKLAETWLAQTRQGERIPATEIANSLRSEQICGRNLLHLAAILVAIHYVCKLFTDTSSIQANLALDEFSRLNLNFIAHAPIREAAMYGLGRLSRLSGEPLKERVGRVWTLRLADLPETCRYEYRAH